MLKHEGKFNCTATCEEALQLVKQYVKNFLYLTILYLKEPLYLYLAMSHKAISVVLVLEQEKKQKPVYFVSRALDNAKV